MLAVPVDEGEPGAGLLIGVDEIVPRMEGGER
jgi:hypothetical protein